MVWKGNDACTHPQNHARVNLAVSKIYHVFSLFQGLNVHAYHACLFLLYVKELKHTSIYQVIKGDLIILQKVNLSLLYDKLIVFDYVQGTVYTPFVRKNTNFFIKYISVNKFFTLRSKNLWEGSLIYAAISAGLRGHLHCRAHPPNSR
jgi:hypothetical protein